MTDKEPKPMQNDLKAVHEEACEIWDANAGFWDDYMGEEGNVFHRELVAPTAERLLALSSGENVLEIACGSGLFARRMAELGARVVAADVSATFLERAKVRTAAYADRITFRLADAVDSQQLAALGDNEFDAAVCNMALMDMAEVEPLFSTLPCLLRPGGRFVFTVCHPCFNTDGCARVVEQTDAEGKITTVYAIKVSKYKGLSVAQGIGIRGQPRPQYYFNRTIGDLFNACFRAGFVLDAMEEPTFAEGTGHESPLSMRRFREMPMVLAARMRLLNR